MYNIFLVSFNEEPSSKQSKNQKIFWRIQSKWFYEVLPVQDNVLGKVGKNIFLFLIKNKSGSLSDVIFDLEPETEPKHISWPDI